MQIVIDIPDEDYNRIKDTPDAFNSLTSRLYKATKHGTSLPKGHGRLIDISEYENYFNTAITYDDGNHIHSVYTNMISTIVEAESEDKG